MTAGISVWVPVISAGAGILGALGSLWLSHIFITKREKRASEEKMNRERYLIASELVFLLEQFAINCELVTRDTGKTEGLRRVPFIERPIINFDTVSGDWRTLRTELMYGIRQLPVLQGDAEGAMALAYGLEESLQKYDAFSERRYRY
ncbi:hypothetical protein [Pantoea sp. At-9b]|uniref:hypothetical protein n=1 Tax=Pantoea sp. (strain At-9b) TaxID=592316 RepID=UPI0001B40108|nr:hypothetical protein [Pantoea sp. At-9b]ADU72151.1 conserved hypothetical protein, putative membrane transporter [Pantoea sp. At-9b]